MDSFRVVYTSHMTWGVGVGACPCHRTRVLPPITAEARQVPSALRHEPCFSPPPLLSFPGGGAAGGVLSPWGVGFVYPVAAETSLPPRIWIVFLYKVCCHPCRLFISRSLTHPHYSWVMCRPSGQGVSLLCTACLVAPGFILQQPSPRRSPLLG